MPSKKLSTSLKKYDKTKAKRDIYISGELGISLNGQKLVEVPNRKGFVYVRLKDNTSELIQAYNASVSPIYGLPVLVVRSVGVYKVVGRNVDRYQNVWGNAPYLPKHGAQHSFNPDINIGGDIVWVYSPQFMPLLGYPSGTSGSPRLTVAPYIVRGLDGAWKYAGNTGTPDITPYLPTTGSRAVMGLVYLDTVSGNPYLLINSGTYIDSSLTGSNQIVSYIPQVTNPNWIPIAGIRLLSGTTQLSWNNVYDVRPFLQVIPTGTVSGGGGGSSGLGIMTWDEGIPLGTGTVLNFVGAGVTATISGSVVNVNIPASGGGGAGGLGVMAQDEGIPLGTGTTFNFVGNGIDASISGSVVRVFATGTPYADQNRYLAPYNYFLGSGNIGYQIGLVNSPDRRNWKIRKEPIIPVGAGGAWDDHTTQFPRLINYNNVLYCYYAGKNTYAWSNFQIGLSISTDLGFNWNKFGGNPILSASQAWENSLIADPLVFYDKDETNPNAKFKMWYLGSSFGQGIGYAYAPSPTGTWTKYGGNPVVSLGSAGQWDDTYILPHAMIRRTDGTYLLFYGGKTGAAWQSGLITFTNPTGTYTRSPYNPILRSDGIGTTLTANLTIGTSIASVADSSIFPIGCPVWVGYNNRFLSKVIDRPSATTIALADLAPFTVNSGDVIISVAKGSLDIRSVLYDDGYTFGIVAHQPDGLTENGVHEVTMLAWSEPQLQTVNIDYGAGIQVPITLAESQNVSVSRENWTMVDMWDTYRGMIPSPTGSSGGNTTNNYITNPTIGIAIQGNGNFFASGTVISFDNNLYLGLSGTVIHVSSPVSTYQRFEQPISLQGGTGTLFQVPDHMYASGSLGVFYNGILQLKGYGYEELIYSSGTYQLLFSPSTGSSHMVSYGIPCIPQIYSTGTNSPFNILDSNSVSMQDSNGTELLDSE